MPIEAPLGGPGQLQRARSLSGVASSHGVNPRRAASGGMSRRMALSGPMLMTGRSRGRPGPVA